MSNLRIHESKTLVLNSLTCTYRSGRSGSEGNTEALRALVQGGVFGNPATTNIFIMTPAIFDLNLNTGTVSTAGTLANGNNPPLYGTSPPGTVDRLDTITTYLGQLMPGVPIKQFVYRRQTIDKLLADGAYGMAMVSESYSLLSLRAHTYKTCDEV